MKKISLLILALLLIASPAWATIIFEDSFTGSASGTELESHTPDTTGTSWSKISSAGSGNLQINADVTSIQSAGIDAAGSSIYTADATYSTANYEVEATFPVFNTSGSNGRTMNLFCRYQDANNFYLAWLEDSAGNTDVRLYSVVAGTATLIGSSDTNPASGNVFTLVCNGNQISLKKNGANVINPVTNSDHTTAGKAGIGAGDFTGITSAVSGGVNIRVGLFKVNTLTSAPTRRGTVIFFP